MTNNISPKLNERFMGMLDSFQQKHKLLAFPYAIVKKYSDDRAGFLAGLISYYGFVSLFPLLIVATSVIQITTQNNVTLRDKFLENATSYFPAFQNSLIESINTPSKSGVALAIALVITLYGARGVAAAIQHAQNHLWGVPRDKRAGFPKSLAKSFGIIFWGGLGLVGAASLTGYAAVASHPMTLRILIGFAGFAVLFFVFWGVFTFGSSARRRPLATIPGSVFAAAGLLILQAVGGYLVSHQLRNQTGLNAQFALVLAMLFWLYLQAQVFLIAAEINTVRVHKLWPRAIDKKMPLKADKKALELYRKREAPVD